MPFPDKGRVLLDGLDIDPFLYFNLAPILFRALMHLQKILKISVLVVPSQRKQPADGRSIRMDAASPLRIQETATILHIHMRQRQPVQHGDPDLPVHHILEGPSGPFAEHPDIVGIQRDGRSHIALTAFAAARTSGTVRPHHIIQFVQTPVGDFRQRTLPKHTTFSFRSRIM